MKKYMILAAVAPLAMLAACGDSTVDAESAAVDPADTAMIDTPEPAPVAATPTPLADAGDFSGTYALAEANAAGAGGAGAAGASGGALNINAADDTYEYTAADGTVRTGKYSRTDDYRLLIEDYEGGPAYFAISNGDLYRLANDVEISDTITVSGDRYARSMANRGSAAGPSASTNSVSDKRE